MLALPYIGSTVLWPHHLWPMIHTSRHVMMGKGVVEASRTPRDPGGREAQSHIQPTLPTISWRGNGGNSVTGMHTRRKRTSFLGWLQWTAENVEQAYLGSWASRVQQERAASLDVELDCGARAMALDCKSSDCASWVQHAHQADWGNDHSISACLHMMLIKEERKIDLSQADKQAE